MALEEITSGDGRGSLSIDQLLTVVDDLAPQFRGEVDDLQFLKRFFRSRDFQHLMTVHDKVRDLPDDKEPCQLLTLAHMIMYDLEESTLKECDELYKCLNSAQVYSVIMACDKIINKDYIIPNRSNPDELKKQEDEDPMMTVRVDKDEKEPLGLTVKSDSAENILISRVIHGTVADRCGLFRAGDVIHEINGYSVHGKSIDEIAEEMSTLTGTIIFKISSSQEYCWPQIRHQPVMSVKALFSYNPMADTELPCSEAGLAFKKGDILVITNKDDPHWWQANHISTTKTGLIPSSRMRQKSEYNISLEQSTNQRLRKKQKEVEYSPLDCEDQGGQEIATYEEVMRMQPLTLHPRPLVLIAPNCMPSSMIDLRSKLITSMGNKFGQAILSTTRPRTQNEEDGKHYYFMSRQDFQRCLQSKQIIEYCEIDQHYFGTSINAIRNVMVSGKTCLLILTPKVLKIVHYMAELKPYVVFFRPPRTAQEWNGLVHQDADYAKAQQESKEMEARYGQYCDKALDYINVERAFIDVQRIADELLTTPQWVPSIWSA